MSFKKVVFIFLFIACLLKGFGQNNKITGWVKDAETKEPLAGVAIFFNNTNGTTSNTNGFFSLTADSTAKTLTFSFIGYYSKVIKIDSLTTYQNLPILLSPKWQTIETFVVTASRKNEKLEETTVSMDILPPSIIQSKNTYNLETAIEQVPSVNIIDGQANIRGGGGFSYGAGSRVMVLLDGMPLMAGDANDVKWNYLPVENISQVEVLKGASSVLFGSSALNGVINVITDNPGENTGTKVSFFQGIYDNPVRPDSIGNIRDSAGNKLTPLKWWHGANPTFSGLSISHSNRKNKFDYAFQVNGFNDQGYRQGETEQRIRGNFQTRYRLNNQWQVGLNGGGMAAKGALFLLWDTDSTALIPSGGVDTATTTLSYYQSNRMHFDPFVKYFSKKGHQHVLRSRLFITDNNNVTQPSATAYSLFSEYQFNANITQNINVVAGAMLQQSEVKSVLYGNHNSKNIAGYGRLTYSKNKISGQIGLRLEQFSMDGIINRDDVLIPKGINFNDTNTIWRDTLIVAKQAPVIPVVNVGINYKIFKYTNARASFGQGYRFPSIAEKHVNTSISLLNIFPNPQLLPEKGWNTEIGIKQGFKIGSFSGYADVALFYSEYRDMMEFAFNYYPPDTAPASPNLGQFLSYLGFKSINVGRARISGIDFSMAAQGNIGEVNIQFLAGYSYMNPINLGVDSAYRATFSDSSRYPILKYRVRRLSKADLQIGYKKFSLGGSVKYQTFMENIDRSFEDPLIGNSDAFRVLKGLKQYRQKNNNALAVVDVRLLYHFTQKTTFSLVCNNAFNKEYMLRPGDIQPQRTFAVRFETKF